MTSTTTTSPRSSRAPSPAAFGRAHLAWLGLVWVGLTALAVTLLSGMNLDGPSLVRVAAAVPGIPVDQVERDVLTPMEAVLSGESGIRRMEGTARDGQVEVIVSFSSLTGEPARDRIERAMGSLRGHLPPGVTPLVSIEPGVSEVDDSGGAALFAAVGVGLVVLVVCLGSWRAGLTTLLLLPLPLVAGVLALLAAGLTLNPLTLLGLLVASAIAIDDATVAQDGTQRYLEHGVDPRGAARLGTAELRGPLTAATLAVLPFLLFPALGGGDSGPWFRSFAVSVAVPVLVSYGMVLTLYPRVMTTLQSGSWPATPATLSRLRAWNDNLSDRYHELLAGTLGRQRWLPALVVLLAAGGLLAGTLLGAARVESGRSPRRIQMDLSGADVSTLAGVAQRVAAEVRSVPGALQVEVAGSPGTRLHLNGERWMLIEANVRAGNGVTRDIESKLATVPLPPGYRLTLRDSGGWPAAGLLVPAVAALILMLGVLTRYFGSFQEPAVLVASMLLPSIAGLSAAAGGGSRALPSLTGTGLVMMLTLRQATLLLSSVRRQRIRGRILRVALIEAARLRLRPVLIGTVTLMAWSGFLIIAGGQLSRFGVVLLTGSAAAAVTTLLVTPALVQLVKQPKS